MIKDADNTLKTMLIWSLGCVLLPSSALGQEVHRLEGDRVAVYNLAGRAEVVPGTGNDLEIQLRRGGRDASDLHADVIHVGGTEALVIHYPGDSIVYPEMNRESATSQRIRNDGTFFSGASNSEGKMVRFSGSGSGTEAWADLRISVPRGRKLSLYLVVGDAVVQSMEGDLHADMGCGILKVHESRGNLEVDLGSGNLEIRNSQGNLEVDIGTGEVDLDGFGGNVNVRSGSGNVSILGITGGELEVGVGSGRIQGRNIALLSVLRINTGSGEVVLSGIAAPDIRASSGTRVSLEIVKDVDELVVSAGPGGVDLHLPDALGAEIEVDTESGIVEADFPLREENRPGNRHHYRGALGNAQGRIRLVTDSGGIRIAVARRSMSWSR